MMRECNQAGVDLIRKYETLSLVSYVCPAGILTIGWGHTGKDVRPNMLISEEKAMDLLLDDIDTACRSVLKMVKTPLNDNQFSALVSFFFNIGETKLKDSTIVKKLNKADYLGAANEFERWNKAKGKVLDGLTKRRIEEKFLFLTPEKEIRQ